MIHEFAVDPDALAGWQNFRYLVEKFGVPQGRLISRFPAKWKKMVYQACESCSEMEKKRIVEGLVEIDTKLLAPGREYDGTKKWVPNAVSSHVERPFRAIITVQSKAGQGDLLDVGGLSDADPRWKDQRGCVIFRTAESIASSVSKLLYCSTNVVLVDQHFSGAARFCNPLRNFIRYACDGSSLQRLEYHLGAKTISADFFRGDLERQRPRLELPEGVKLTFIRWKQLFEGDQQHPRYVLTERGGIRIEVGLDEGDPGTTTDVECLAEAIYSLRWSQFQINSGHFELVDAWIVTSDSVVKARWDGNGFVPDSTGVR